MSLVEQVTDLFHKFVKGYAMRDRQIVSNDSEKVPSYVPVYNIIYARIKDGTYKEGDVIPSETKLAKECGVSRHTLRQALTILKEDGLIRKQQGKGSVVTLPKKKWNDSKSYFNPMTEYASQEVDRVDVNYNFAPATNIACEKLNLASGDMLIASNNIYYVGNETIGHAFMQIPLDYAKSIRIDITSSDDVADLMNKGIFERAKSAHVSMRLVKANKNLQQFLNLQKRDILIYLDEILYDEENTPICRSKFYFIPEHYDLEFWI